MYVEGTPEVRTYTKNDGTTGVSLTLRVLSVQLLGGRGDGGGSSSDSGYNSGNNYGSGNSYNSNSGGSNVSSENEISEPVDDLPF